MEANIFSLCNASWDDGVKGLLLSLEDKEMNATANMLSGGFIFQTPPCAACVCKTAM